MNPKPSTPADELPQRVPGAPDVPEVQLEPNDPLRDPATAPVAESGELNRIATFLRTDSNTIQHTVTVHDPLTYTQDWMNVRTWRLKPAGDVVMEYSCEENNLDNIINGAIKRWTPPEDEN